MMRLGIAVIRGQPRRAWRVGGARIIPCAALAAAFAAQRCQRPELIRRRAMLLARCEIMSYRTLLLLKKLIRPTNNNKAPERLR